MPPRRFTVEEAAQLLPRLSAIVSEMQELKREHDRFREKAAALGIKMKSNGHLLGEELRESREGMERTAQAVGGLLKEVQETGCELKDIDQGLVDFRAERDGHEVYLCWKLGEERISWWHDLQSGYAGRQPLD